MKVVAIFSGGMDSATLLHHLREKKHQVAALSFNYGQRHSRELDFATRFCQTFGFPHTVADISAIKPLIAKGSLTGHAEVPEGHYADESMKATVVPNRNMIMLAIAAGFAIAVHGDAVAYGAHAGDHAIYPDCRPEFVEAMSVALGLCDWKPPAMLAPFLSLTKTEICGEGARLGVDFAMTWSCYKGGIKHCGKCGTCVERREAFGEAGVTDPTEYE